MSRLLDTGYEFEIGVNDERVQARLFVDPETWQFHGHDLAHPVCGHGQQFANVERQLLLLTLDRQRKTGPRS